MQEIIDRATGVDFTETRVLFEQRVDAPWPRHLLNEVELECRRLMILEELHPDETIGAMGPVGEFWAAHLERLGKASGRDLTFDEALIGRLYREVFGSPLPDLWVGRDMARIMDMFPGIAG